MKIGPLKIADREWFTWLAMIHYYMGDYISSFRILNNQLIEEKPVSKAFQVSYYLLLSNMEFKAIDKELDPILSRVVEQYIPLLPAPDSSEVNNLKKHQLREYYYAAHLLYLDSEHHEALKYFKAIQHCFLPAAYMALYLVLQKQYTERMDGHNNVNWKEWIGDFRVIKEWPTDTLGHILTLEKKRICNGLQPYTKLGGSCQLNLDLSNWSQPFLDQFYFREIREGIATFIKSPKASYLPHIKSIDIVPFYDVYQLSDEKIYKCFSNIITTYREELWDTMANIWVKGMESNTQLFDGTKKIREKIGLEGKIPLLTYYDSLTKDKLTSVKKMLAEDIDESRIQKLKLKDYKTAKQYSILTSALVIAEAIEPMEKILLDYYAHTSLHKSIFDISEGIEEGLVDFFKHGSGVMILMTTGIIESFITPLPMKLIDACVTPFFSAIGATEFIQFIRKGKTTFTNFQDFEKRYRAFYGEKIDRQGMKFLDNNPTPGLREWIDRKE